MAKKSQATDKKVAIAKSLEIATAENSPKEYKLLNQVNDYDHAVVDELVEAQNEIALLQGRINLLQDLANEFKDLNKFVWKTAEGVNIALHNIETDHLENILKHLTQLGRSIPKEFRVEALSRGLTVPVQHVSMLRNMTDAERERFEYYQYAKKWGIGDL